MNAAARSLALLVVASVHGACGTPGSSAETSEDPARLVDRHGEPVAGALVSARDSAGVRVTVYTARSGGFVLPSPPGAPVEIEVRVPEAGRVHRWANPEWPVRELRIGGTGSDLPPPASAWLASLPEGEEKRRFLMNCTACHVWDRGWIGGAGGDRSFEGWRSATERMVEQLGPRSGFPVVAGDVDPERLSRWLDENFGTGNADPSDPIVEALAAGHATLGRAILTEYPVPDPGDLPHDLAVDADGRVVITGMLTHRMYVLDPGTGAMEVVPIPRASANPRALDIASDGAWWVVLGAPGEIARYDSHGGSWEFHGVGTYPHSVMIAPDGRVWYNGHFTHSPEIVGVLDPESGDTTTYAVPRTPDSDAAPEETTIPYGLRVDRDGIVWATQLRGGNLVRLDPGNGSVRQWRMPTEHAGPRRPDVGPDGSIWIPQYGAGRLARFDPVSETFEEWELPMPDALPYVVRVDPVRGTVWIGTGHADALFAFDPDRETFTAYPLPTRGALVRHLDVDPSNGEVWAAYGAWPGIPAKVLRLTPTEVEPR